MVRLQEKVVRLDDGLGVQVTSYYMYLLVVASNSNRSGAAENKTQAVGSVSYTIPKLEAGAEN